MSNQLVERHSVSPEYFRAMGVPIAPRKAIHAR